MQPGVALVGIHHGHTSFSDASARPSDQPGESNRLQIINASTLAVLKIFEEAIQVVEHELGLEPEIKILFDCFRLNELCLW